MKFCVQIFILSVIFANCLAYPVEFDEDQHMHAKKFKYDPRYGLEVEKEPEYWKQKAMDTIDFHLKVVNKNTAKNVIMFLGDGMSIPTITAARIYMGQLQDQLGEEAMLSFEQFPVTGLSKTYCVDGQVADSACSATAYLCGVKTNDGTIGVKARVGLGDCDGMTNKTNHVYSIAKKFLDKGRSAGLLTTTRVTHASPSGVFAHTAHRDWENNEYIKKNCGANSPNKDIAYQLIKEDIGKQLKVIMGGGRREFLPKSVIDEEGKKGYRTDDLNLIEEWKKMRGNESNEYVWNRKQLLEVDEKTDYLLGLFESDHCQYHLQSNPETEPTFEEMVEAGIKVLSKNDKGFFLFCEGGRIDHAHHKNFARMALDETVEFSKGIAKAVQMTSRDDTLIVVTSDHAHAMTMSGYPKRGRNILEDVGYHAEDNVTYTTLSYANGLGYRKDVNGKRYDATKDPNLREPDYKFPAMVPLDSETHGGDDVAVFALGPQQHLFTGNYEQSTIPYLMSFASCVDDDKSACNL